MSTPEVTTTTRTPALATIEQVASQVRQVREWAVEEQGAGTELFVQIQSQQSRFIRGWGSVEEHRDHLGRLAEAGVDSFVLQPSGTSVDIVIESLRRYAATFIG